MRSVISNARELCLEDCSGMDDSPACIFFASEGEFSSSGGIIDEV